jgi:hypothetical protein
MTTELDIKAAQLLKELEAEKLREPTNREKVRKLRANRLLKEKGLIKYRSFLRLKNYPAVIIEHLKTVTIYMSLWPLYQIGYRLYPLKGKHYPKWMLYNIVDKIHDIEGDFKDAIFELKYDVLRLPLYLPPVITKEKRGLL